MRLYTRSEFLELPAGTVYCQGGEWYFENLCFKAETRGNDWRYTDPAWVDCESSEECIDRLIEMKEHKASYAMQESEGRDGCYNDDDLFLVFEKPDLEKLRTWIDAAISACDIKESSFTPL